VDVVSRRFGHLFFYKSTSDFNLIIKAPSFIIVKGREGFNDYAINGTFELCDSLHEGRVFYSKLDKTEFLYWSNNYSQWLLNTNLGGKIAIARSKEDDIVQNPSFVKNWDVRNNDGWFKDDPKVVMMGVMKTSDDKQVNFYVFCKNIQNN
jgi:hypothetical protein